MKKLVVLIALLVGFTAANAQDFNPVVPSGEVTLTTNVIHPLYITNVQEETNIPTVIKGQIRDLDPDQSYITFHISRDEAYTVNFRINFAPYPVNGVVLDGSWVIQPFDADLELISGRQVIPNTGEWWWNAGYSDNAYVYLKLDKIDASDPSVSTGVAHFTAEISGEYAGL